MFKKTLLASAILLASVSASAADVQVYGRIDGGLRYTHQLGSGEGNLSMHSGNRGSGRWGMNIVEEINSDLTIKAYLEGGFKMDTGAQSSAGSVFERRSILAVETPYGELGFGRMGSVQSSAAPFTMGLIKFDPFGTSYTDASVTTTFANSDRNNNSIVYRSPKMAGFQFGATYSFGATDDTEATAKTGNRDRTIALASNYSAGPLFVTAMFSQKNFSNNATTQYEDARSYGLGATYALASTKLFAGIQYQTDWRTGAKIKASGEHGFDGWSGLVGATHTMGAHKLLTSVQYFDGEISNDSEQDAQRYVIAGAYEYSLSKTATAYFAATYSNVEGHFESSNQDLNRYMLMIGLDKRF